MRERDKPSENSLDYSCLVFFYCRFETLTITALTIPFYLVLCIFFLLFDVDCFAWLTTPNRKHVIENYPLASNYVDGIRCERVSGKPIPLKWIYNLLCYCSLVFLAFFSEYSLLYHPFCYFDRVSMFFFYYYFI